jgi:hypothetical protein
MLYKLLGFIVWKVGKFVVRRRMGKVRPSRRVAFATLIAIAVIGLAFGGAKRSGQHRS